MELKDVVLQTLSEIENSVDEKGYQDIAISHNVGEVEFLHSLKERLFVLFEGLKQSKDLDSLNSKADLIISFLQFQLALIDMRLEVIEKRLKDEG